MRQVYRHESSILCSETSRLHVRTPAELGAAEHTIGRVFCVAFKLRIVAVAAPNRHGANVLRRGTTGVLMGFAMLEILYDNGPCLVINKPAGILTQAPAGIDSLEVQVKAFYREREGKEGNIYLGLPH